MNKIVIVDYGTGNLRSVAQAVQHAAPEVNVAISNSIQDLRNSHRIVLPGQGAMPDCMQKLRESGLLEALVDAASKKPLLGVCVGEQMLFDWSEEGNTKCLSLFPGKILKLQLNGQLQADGSRFKVPQMGWNQVRQIKPHALWEGIPNNSHFYFVHSFYAKPSNFQHIVGTTDYGENFCCAVARDNIFATQFHPEKSAAAGLRVYQNFANWSP